MHPASRRAPITTVIVTVLFAPRPGNDLTLLIGFPAVAARYDHRPRYPIGVEPCPDGPSHRWAPRTQLRVSGLPPPERASAPRSQMRPRGDATVTTDEPRSGGRVRPGRRRGTRRTRAAGRGR